MATPESAAWAKVKKMTSAKYKWGVTPKSRTPIQEAWVKALNNSPAAKRAWNKAKKHAKIVKKG